eukprot:403332523
MQNIASNSASNSPLTVDEAKQFEQLLQERLQNQEQWLKTYEDMPKIQQNSKTFKDLCLKIVTQQDYFVAQLKDLSEQFHGHTLTKLSKKLKSENISLEKTKSELQNQVTVLNEQNDEQIVEIQDLKHQLENISRTLKFQQLQNDQQKSEIDELKKQNDLLIEYQQKLFINNTDDPQFSNNLHSPDYKNQKKFNNSNTKSDSLNRPGSAQSAHHEEQSYFNSNNLQSNEFQNKHQDQQRQFKTEDSLENIKFTANQKEVFDVTSTGTLQNQAVNNQLQVSQLEEDMQDLRKSLSSNKKDSNYQHQLEQYQEQIQSLNEQIFSQDKQHLELLRHHASLEREWKSMEKYIRELNSYQKHIEEKYQMLLEQFQVLVLESARSSPNKQLSREDQETIYINMLKNKDEEIKYLKDELRKVEILNEELQQLNDQQRNDLQNNDKIQLLQNQYHQMEQIYQQAISEKENQIFSLEQNLKQNHSPLSTKSQKHQSPSRDIQPHLQQEQELQDLYKDKEINQKLIQQLQLQLRDQNSKIQKFQDKKVKQREIELELEQQSSQYARDIQLLQRQVEQKEKENLDLRRHRINDSKDLNDLKELNKNLQNEIQQLQQNQEQLQEQNSLLQNNYNQNDQIFQDKSEIQFYLQEMKEVKHRIIINLVEVKSLIMDQKLDSLDNEQFDMQATDLTMDSMRNLVFQVKDLVRRELEHLMILNSYTIELQQQVSSKFNDKSQRNLNATQYQQLIQKSYEKELRDKLTPLLLDSQSYLQSQRSTGNSTSLDDIIDQAVLNFKQLLDENNQLLQDRESYKNQNIQGLMQECEKVRTQYLELQQQLVSFKSNESSKIKEMELQMMERSKEERNHNLKLVEEQNDLQLRNKNLQNEISKLLNRVTELENTNQELEKDCSILKKKIELGNLANQIQLEKQDLSPQDLKRLQQSRDFNKNDQSQIQSEKSNSHYAKYLKSYDQYEQNLNKQIKQSVLSPKVESYQKKLQIQTPEDNDSIEEFNQQRNQKDKLNQNKPESIYSSAQSKQKNTYKEAENYKLNSLIDEYRKENEKCAQKIQSLQQKLQVTTNKISSTEYYKRNSFSGTKNGNDLELQSESAQNHKIHIQSPYQTFTPNQQQYSSQRVTPSNYSQVNGQTPNSQGGNYRNHAYFNDQLDSNYFSYREKTDLQTPTQINTATVIHKTQYSALRNPSLMNKSLDKRSAAQSSEQRQNNLYLDQKTAEFSSATDFTFKYKNMNNPISNVPQKLKSKPISQSFHYRPSDQNKEYYQEQQINNYTPNNIDASNLSRVLNQTTNSQDKVYQTSNVQANKSSFSSSESGDNSINSYGLTKTPQQFNQPRTSQIPLSSINKVQPPQIITHHDSNTFYQSSNNQNYQNYNRTPISNKNNNSVAGDSYINNGSSSSKQTTFINRSGGKSNYISGFGTGASKEYVNQQPYNSNNQY